MSAFGTIILITFLILLNGFFVASEFAFVKLRSSRLDELRRKENRISRTIVKIHDNLNDALSTIQLGITLASIALGFVGEPFFDEIFTYALHDIFVFLNLSEGFITGFTHTISFIAAYAIITFLHVIIGEIMPKTMAIQSAEKVAIFTALPLAFCIKMLHPFTSFFVWTSNHLLRLIGIDVVDEEEQDISSDELKIIVNDSAALGHINENQVELLHNVIDYNKMSVEEILTPRLKVRALDVNSSLQELINLISETGYSRIPIYEEKLDNLLGFVHIKDMLRYLKADSKENFDLRKHLRPLIVVHERVNIDVLLGDMQEKNIQMAAIVEEFGSLEGIVTMENIIEQLLGPIKDEFDYKITEPSLEKDGNIIIVSGNIALQDFNEEYEEELKVTLASDKSVTLAGYVLELYDGEIPKEGDFISDKKLWFKIISKTKKRIDEIKVSKFNPSLWPENVETE